jgi:ParB family transcriptional regulator, chromosome partitioning protein
VHSGPPVEVADQLDALPDEIDRFTTKASAYSAEDAVGTGVFISIGHDGEARIERGFIHRKDDAKPIGDAGSDGDRRSNGLGSPNAVEADDGDGTKPLSEKVLTDPPDGGPPGSSGENPDLMFALWCTHTIRAFLHQP